MLPRRPCVGGSVTQALRLVANLELVFAVLQEGRSILKPYSTNMLPQTNHGNGLVALKAFSHRRRVGGEAFSKECSAPVCSGYSSSIGFCRFPQLLNDGK